MKAVRAVGAGGAGGRAGAAIEHYSSLFLGEACLFLGGKEDMWAVREVGMEACGGVGSVGGVGSEGGGGGCAGGGVGA